MPKTPHNPYTQRPSRADERTAASLNSDATQGSGVVIGTQEPSAQTSALTADQHQMAKKPRVPAQVGVYGLVLLVVVVTNAILGAVWGTLRPGFEASADNQGNLSLSPDFNVEFSAFAVFLLATTVVAVLSVIVSIWQSTKATSLGMLLWLGLWNFVGARVFLVCGDLIVAYIRNADVTAPEAGETVRIIPWVGVGIAGAVWSAFVAMAVYWSAMVITLPKDQPAAADAEEASVADSLEPSVQTSGGSTPLAQTETTDRRLHPGA